MSPMCADSQASRPSARQKVFLRSAADREHGRHLERKAERQRRLAAGPAYRRLETGHRPRHRVVAGHVDRAVVQQPGVRQPAQPAQRVVVVE